MYNPLKVRDFGRKEVLVLGDCPLDSNPFQKRNLILKFIKPEEIDEATAEGIFNTCKAIIIADNLSTKFKLLRSCATKIFPLAENYGLIKKILVYNDRDVLRTNTLLGTTSSENVFYLNKVEDLAESLARYTPGPPAEPVEIEGKMPLEEEVKLLLRRSFFGCEKIHVESISGGKASLGLFKVYASLKNSEVGPSPSPFFAKIAGHSEIKTEMEKYRVYTDHFIPFQYRPNCRIERCSTTKTFSSLIGDFVDESISLQSALQNTHHSGIIFSLFEKGLKRLRLQPFVANKPPTEGKLKQFIKEKIKVEELIKKTGLIAKAKSLGLKSDILYLHNRLLDYCPHHCIMGPLHGDLNSRNIVVKGSDAILIDFYSMDSSGPLTADPATLEISLCFDVGEKFVPAFKIWKKFIDEAYDPDKILKPLAYSEQIPSELSWLRRAIREIRHVYAGCHCEPEEVKAVIAAYLMRIARLAQDDLSNSELKLEFRMRAYALVVAERIIKSLEKKA